MISMFCHDIMQTPFPPWFRQHEHALVEGYAQGYVNTHLVNSCGVCEPCVKEYCTSNSCLDWKVKFKGINVFTKRYVRP